MPDQGAGGKEMVGDDLMAAGVDTTLGMARARVLLGIYR
jgi:hypothetical protein